MDDDEDDCSKTVAGAVAAFPDDILVDILARVPAKTVCRFKCVSKAWRDLIADPDHSKKLRHAMQGFFFMTPTETNNISMGFVEVTAGSVPMDDDPGFSFLTERPGMHKLILLDSCNGLILFGHRVPPDYAELSNIVCNPTTKQCEYVPSCCAPDDRYKHTFLAFDPAVSSQFHLVQFQVSHEHLRLEALRAYSSETGTWSHNQIYSQEEQGLLAGWHRHVTLNTNPRCTFVNGFLHLIVWGLDQEQIVVVDVQGKAKRMITVPGVADEGHYSCYLEQSQGCLHFMTMNILDGPEVYKLSIWVLQDYDTQEWVLKNIMSSLELYGELTGHFLNFCIVDIHRS